jgi:hypothetical protein
MATVEEQYEIRADRSTNRLYLTLQGTLEAEQVADAAQEAVDKAETLRPGFDIINDISRFRPPSPEAAEPIKEAQADLLEMGVERVVRVADGETSQVVLNAFSRRSKQVGYEGMTAESVAEAERTLS